MTKHKKIQIIIVLICLIPGVLLISMSFDLLGNQKKLGMEKEPDTLHIVSSHLREKYTGDLSRLIERRYIRVLTTFNKTNFFISGGQLYGFEYSLLKEYEKFLNMGIKKSELKIVLEIIPVSRDALIPMLNEGLGDIAAAGLTITPDRLKEIDFTTPYLTGIDEVIVVNGSVKGLKKIEDLSGRKIFVRASSSYYEGLLSLNDVLSKKAMVPIEIIKVDETLEMEDILELLNSEAIDITVSDSHIAKIWASVFNNIRIMNHLKVRKGGKIAWMIRKGNPELKSSLNQFIKAHKKGTLLGNIFFNRYYKNNKWIRNPLTEKEHKKILYYIDLFKKYANKYNFDWMLIMALAYQESGLDHSKKSPFGAIGLMQIKPSTAAGKKIGIHKVTEVENNIHAGTKYLAFLRDYYFSDPNIKEKDRIRFTLAAYNAGPNKIKKVRKLALQMGLNPNRWFRNVEMAALKSIGQETVRYVSNINKYYIIYRLGLNYKNNSQRI
ncbi:MAG: transglycosylase SLT domain-containing protein [bacterium]